MTSTPPNAGQELVPIDFNDPGQLGRVFAASGYFRDATKISQAITKILAGRELGFSPMASMMGVHIIEGKPTFSSNIMAAALRRSERYDYSIVGLTDERCEIRFSMGAEPLEPTSVFTLDDAKRAGLVRPKGGWEKYPRNMLFARALTNGMRWHCPDLLGGMPAYSEDEGAELAESAATIMREPAVFVDDIAPDGTLTAPPDAEVVSDPPSERVRALAALYETVEPDLATWQLKLVALGVEGHDTPIATLAPTLPVEVVERLIDWLNIELDKQLDEGDATA